MEACVISQLFITIQTCVNECKDVRQFVDTQHKMQASICYVVLTSIFWQCCFAQDDPEVETKYGRVRGQSVYLSSGQGIDTFLGVPYAKAPVGDLRFQVYYS